NNDLWNVSKKKSINAPHIITSSNIWSIMLNILSVLIGSYRYNFLIKIGKSFKIIKYS
ncbi:hypothetical protein C2G38_2118568, partial [Gigaspora rosea]